MLTTPYKRHLEYPQCTMFQMIERIAKQYPDETAYELYGKKTTYAAFIRRIERAARAFTAMGIRRDDRVTICMPNVPQALDCFYALNRIGAVANMIHPQSAVKEMIFYLNLSDSKAILTLDMFADAVEQAVAQADHPVTVLIARMQDELPPHLAALYLIRAGRKYLRWPDTDHAKLWKSFLREGDKTQELPDPRYEEGHTCAILYSGGTSGIPKGICLTDLNFNACAMQAREAIQEEFRTGLSMLACMPVFHGFGLGINFHAILMHGPCCILMPTFNAKSYADILIKKKPSFIAGVPTIFDELLDKFAALPRPILILAIRIIRWLDFWGVNPKVLTEGDPNYTTILCSNLGSIQCPSVYHHLNNYGTNSIMITIGSLHKEEVIMPDGTKEIRDIVDVGATLDERIADGFYFARSLKLIKYIFANPELLERPLGDPSGFRY